MKTKERRDILFEADCELTAIRKDHVRFRVGLNQHSEENPLGYGNVTNLTHLDIPRLHFPKDDDFSLDFINSDLDALAATGRKDDEKQVKALKKKQAEFQNLAKCHITIFR